MDLWTVTMLRALNKAGTWGKLLRLEDLAGLNCVGPWSVWAWHGLVQMGMELCTVLRGHPPCALSAWTISSEHPLNPKLTFHGWRPSVSVRLSSLSWMYAIADPKQLWWLLLVHFLQRSQFGTFCSVSMMCTGIFQKICLNVCFGKWLTVQWVLRNLLQSLAWNYQRVTLSTSILLFLILVSKNMYREGVRQLEGVSWFLKST